MSGVDPIAHNREAWDRQVAAADEWTQPVSSEEIVRARAGDWAVAPIGHEPAPQAWFPESLRGVDILGVRGGQLAVLAQVRRAGDDGWLDRRAGMNEYSFRGSCGAGSPD